MSSVPAAALVPQLTRAVRLLGDIPELGLRSGEVGIVCSEWFAPTTAYEVEFAPQNPGLSHATRALLMANQIEELVRN